MSGRVHIAGPSVIIGGRFHRQRCAWCGEAIIDDDLERIGVVLKEGEQRGPPLAFAQNNLVRIVDGNPRQVVIAGGPDDRLPLDFCDPRCVR